MCVGLYVGFHRMRSRDLGSRCLGLPSGFSSYDIWLAWQPQVCGGISNVYTIELCFCCCCCHHPYGYNCPGSFYFSTYVHLKRLIPAFVGQRFVCVHTCICFDLFPFECICGSVMQYFNLKFAFHCEWKATLLWCAQQLPTRTNWAERCLLLQCVHLSALSHEIVKYIFLMDTHAHTDTYQCICSGANMCVCVCAEDCTANKFLL